MDVTTGAELPEECIATIISFTSPRDACRASLVSPIFRSAAGSDLVWERLLPQDYQQIISESVSPGPSSSASLNILSKKDLYFHLCDTPILIGNGNRSFAIDKLSGKKCYMLGARELSIINIGRRITSFWEWISSAEMPVLAQSRFSEVARLGLGHWLRIRGRIETQILSPNTKYGAYFTYAIADRNYNLHHPVKLSIRYENERNATNAHLLPDTRGGYDGRLPSMREDMWMEIEIGEFFTDQVDSVVEMCLMDTACDPCKSGLVVHGIELRPK